MTPCGKASANVLNENLETANARFLSYLIEISLQQIIPKFNDFHLRIRDTFLEEVVLYFVSKPGKLFKGFQMLW